MSKIAKLNREVYPSLSEVDQLVIDINIDPKKEYLIESEEVENGTTYLYLEGVSNVGFNLQWFKIIN